SPALEGVGSVYSVTAPGTWWRWSRAPLRRPRDVIADHLSKVDGIQDTETMLAFRTYSSEDLGEGWELGFDS
ncbi:AsnC family transcriptional regulator, partial [Micrococcus luteus]